MKHFIHAVCVVLVFGSLSVAEIKLDQIISRENPAFQCERARLAVGRDGRVYRFTAAPRWRVWGRIAGAGDYREFLLHDDSLKVPADCAGLFQLFVTPDVLPGHSGVTSDYRLQSWIEIRQPGTAGSASVLTAGNRTHFGRGEEIPFSVVVRAMENDKPVSVTVRLVQDDRVVAEGKTEIKTNGLAVAFVLPQRLTSALMPGDYMLTAEAPGLTGVPALMTIGRGLRCPHSP